MKHWKLNAFALAIAVNYPIQAISAEAEQENDEQTEVIEVRGVQYSDQKARLIERDKKQFSSVVSTDDLGNFVDQNVAESLRRMPGITLQRSEGEGKFVTVRGLGPEFVSVNMNGSQMAGMGDDRKIGLDSLAGDALGSIEVIKTLTPDMDLNSIGGVVNVKAISAYDRGKNTLKLKAQDSYSELREAHSPKFTIDGTQFLLDKTVGLGFVLSSESRSSVVNEQRHHSSNDMEFYQQNFAQPIYDEAGEEIEQDFSGNPEIIAPQEFELRQEQADRDRFTAALNVEYRPNDANQFYVRGNYVEYTDEDVAYREFYRFQGGGAGDGEILFVDDQTHEFIVSDADLQHQFFIQTSTKETTTFNFGGKHLVGDAWTIDYDFTTSKAVEDATGDRRVQFRERDLILYGRGSEDAIDARVISEQEVLQYRPDIEVINPNFENGDIYGFGLSSSGTSTNNRTGGNINDPANLEFDNVFLEGSTRTDEIKTFKFNAQYDFLDSDWFYYVKAGFSLSDRDHVTDKNRWSYIPETDFCNEADQWCRDAINANHENIALPKQDGGFGFDLEFPKNGDFQYPFVSRDALNYLIDSIEYTKEVATEGDEGYVSLSNDYVLSEDTQEAYVMGEMELADRLTLITGVRYVETEYASTGYMTIRNDRFSFDGNTIDVFQPLPEASINYSEFFPSAHLRYEPTDNILIRGAIWSSYTRPSFKQSRSYAKFDSRLQLCAPGNPTDCSDDPDDFDNFSALDLEEYTLGPENTMQIGNPNLIPMTATNYDASISWYHSEDLFMEAAVFYKDIKNFIVDVRGINRSFDELPLTLPVNQVTEFIIPQDLTLTNVNITLNGDNAKVYGMELSYNQFFDSGFFVQSNATVQTSEASLDPSIRKSKIALPDQADMTANLTLGWENDDFNVRIIGNYRSDILEQVGSCPDSVESTDIENCKVWSDQYQSGLKTLDFKTKYDFGGGLSMYFDAINLTDNVDLRYFEGDAMSGGRVLYQREEYGRTIQVGVNYKFY